MGEDRIAYEVGSGNVFADLGLPNPEERKLKAHLAGMIYELVATRGWTQKHTAEVLGVTQPDISKITRGILKDFSVERLLHFLGKLDQRVTITVSGDELPTREIVIAASSLSDEHSIAR
ncbi:MAG: helix-turn-helix domain-containing protein [Deinococcota bacterium]|nr:helix-turn-helix domain-containing protein [Deinococcota bacterium]